MLGTEHLAQYASLKAMLGALHLAEYALLWSKVLRPRVKLLGANAQ